MYRNARVYVADMLDRVVVQASVFTSDWRGDEPASEETFSVTVQSTGEDSDEGWLKDALIALVETL